MHLWDPPFCGDIDMLISRDGTWFHEGSAIRRPAMVSLFASVLKLEADGEFYLVTPIEKVRIRVTDCPFVVVEMESTGSGRQQKLAFTTTLGETVIAGINHPIEVTTHSETEEPHPSIEIRNGLRALINRAVFYRLVELAIKFDSGDDSKTGVWSDGKFFQLGSIVP